MIDETYDYITDELIRLGITPTGSYQRAFGRQILAPCWSEPVNFRQAAALPILKEFADGHAATDAGWADILLRLDEARAVVYICLRCKRPYDSAEGDAAHCATCDPIVQAEIEANPETPAIGLIRSAVRLGRLLSHDAPEGVIDNEKTLLLHRIKQARLVLSLETLNWLCAPYAARHVPLSEDESQGHRPTR